MVFHNYDGQIDFCRGDLCVRSFTDRLTKRCKFFIRYLFSRFSLFTCDPFRIFGTKWLKTEMINLFRKVAIAEGISYLVLLLIAMPLKYLAGLPEAVKVVGWIHGALFMAYVATLLGAWWKAKWSFGFAVWAFVASLLPFGTFILDKQLRRAI